MTIYLDYQSAKPVDERVMFAMIPYFTEKFGNPSGLHSEGDLASDALINSRYKIAEYINAPNDYDIVFTTGATESNNLAIIGTALENRKKGNEIIISDIEHISTLNIAKYLETQGFKIKFAPVDEYGIVIVDRLQELITNKTILISVSTASNEVGSIQPVKSICDIARDRDILFHSDAVPSQSVIPIDVQEIPFDLLTLSSNEIYGPKGIGALYNREGTPIKPTVIGDRHERGLRGGSENMPGIIGFAKAAEIIKKEIHYEAFKLKVLRDKLINNVLDLIPQSYLNGHPTNRLPNNAHFRFDYVDGNYILLSLSNYQISAATGIACCMKDVEPLHTLRAMGISEKDAEGSLLFTLGRNNKLDDIERVIEVLPDIIQELRFSAKDIPSHLLQLYKESAYLDKA